VRKGGKKVAEFQEKGFKREVAAIKSISSDQRMQVVVSEMTNFDQGNRTEISYPSGTF
jgi:hypothetical protein